MYMHMYVYMHVYPVHADYVCEQRPTRADTHTSVDPDDPHAPYDVSYCGDELTTVFCLNGGSCRSERQGGADGDDDQWRYYCECDDGWYGDDCSIGECRLLI